jgi:fibronectin-binding autotransporter adhesin
MLKRLEKFNRMVPAGLLLTLLGLPLASQAQSTWNGSADTDWNNAANWSAGVPSAANAIINSNSPNIATITTTISATPVDIFVGNGAGLIGRVNHHAGDAFTGDGNWMFVGQNGATGTYNLADTATTGGVLTGFGLGSGNLTAGGNGTGGNLFVGRFGGGIGTFNMNSSGTLTVREYFIIGGNAATGTFNLDSGTVAVGRDIEVGGNSTSGSGTMKVSGGTVTADIVTVGRGNNNVSTVTGLLDVTGGTINSLRWFTLGFAGNSSDIGTVTNNGGNINVNTGGGGNMEMTVWDTSRALFVQNSGALNIQNSATMFFGVNGNAGVATFEHNGGTVTFYADGGTTVGGIGRLILGNQSGSNPWEISSGTYTYNLNAGTLTVPEITRVSPNASGTFNFNGGTLKPAGASTVFMQGLTTANIQSGGALIDTDGYDVTIGQPISGTGALTKLGAGTLTLAGTNIYTGTTTISAGTLALSGDGSLVSTVVIPAGLVFDVTSLTANLQNPVSGVGSVNGNVTSAPGLAVYPATDGTVGTLTFNNDLNMSGGGSLRLDLSTSHLSGNDQVAVTGNLTVSSATVIRIKALSGAANLSTTGNYVLCTVGGTLTVNSTPSLAWDGTLPGNYLNYSVAQVGNTLVLQFAAATAPTVTATSTPATVVRNQSVTVTATVTPGSGSVTNVQVDASQIGSSASAGLVLSSTANVYTNTFTIPNTLAPGVKVLTVVAKANTGLNSPGFAVTNTVVATNEVWTGLGANNNWSTSPNWNTAAPGLSGDAVTFAGNTRLTPDLDANYSVTGVSFAPGAGSFTLGSTFGSTLTLAASSGVVNNSANAQTVNVPITQSAAQTYNAAAGNLVINQTITKGGNLVTVTGAAHTVFGAAISDSGSLFKKGSGSLTISNGSNWDLAQASSGGFSGPFIAQAGTVRLNNGSFHAVTGELVIGGVVANGGVGNNAALVVDNATLNVSSWLSIGRGNGVGGVSSDLVITNGATVTADNVSAGYNANSTANQPKGSITLSDTSSLSVSGGNFFVGESDGAAMTLNVNGTSTINASAATLNVGINSAKGVVNLNGGTISVGSMRVGAGANLNSTAQGTVTVNSGTLNSEGDVMLGFAGSGAGGDIGKLIINNGTVNVATGTKRSFNMNQWDTCASQLDVNGGTLNLNAETDIHFAIGNNTGTNVINLNGGSITFFSDNATTVGGTGVVNMHQGNGATVQNAFNLNGGTLTTSSILSSNASGTRLFSFHGGTLKATMDAVSLLDLGAGDAHAYVRTGGAIIDTDSKNVIVASALEHSPADLTDGGLIKKGLGTLNLTGANSYLGNTIVQAGTLQLAQATLAASSTVAISNAATLQLDFATTNRVSVLVLNGVNQAGGVYNNSTSPTFITGTGSLLVQPIATNPTNITAVASGNTLALSWPADHLGWILQQQTNSLTTGLSTNWVDVAGSANITSTNVTINPASPTVFYRLRLP